MGRTASVEHVAAGISGHVGRYDVFIANDLAIIVEDVEDGKHVRREIEGLGEFVQEAEAFRLGGASSRTSRSSISTIGPMTGSVTP